MVKMTLDQCTGSNVHFWILQSHDGTYGWNWIKLDASCIMNILTLSLCNAFLQNLIVVDCQIGAIELPEIDVKL
jgi:hypothetical protein